ncbi:MAG: carboxypeptidase regulatory-like domain-containing protein [Acidobacteriia bacterium]|nr:carboxypeptidase regulatory-like domain-containing protein [Terriglobia bacterium]
MLRSFWVVLALSVIAPAQTPAPDKLPIKRVVLYKNGVGYFEHQGQVQGNQDVGISFTSGQLNDVLKSLTVLDLNGGRITGVNYGSSAPIDRQIGDLRLPIGQKTSLMDFLDAIRGARVEVKSGQQSLSGRLLSIERKTRIAGGNTSEVDFLSLITESGEVRTTELSPAFSVKLQERGLSDKVERYLDLASASREPDIRRMSVSTEGTGERSLFLSYISEVPVWKATYRIVLSPKQVKMPLLQGWAIVDNTVGQDWENVQLSLVAGAPQSFIQNLSQPFYTRRPVVPLSEALMMQPQTYQATLIPGVAQIAGTISDPSGAVVANATVRAYDLNGNLLGSVNTDARGDYAFNSLPAGQVRLEVSVAGFKKYVHQGVNVGYGAPMQRDVRLEVGSVAESVTVTAEASRLNTQASTVSRNNLGSGSNLGNFDRLNQYTNLQKSYGQVGGGLPFAPNLEAARSSVETAAVARDLGDLFEYKLKEPISIIRNQSAMVPIVQSPISAEKVSVWNYRSSAARPQRALWLNNTTGVTLDGGSFNVLEQDTFAGEGIFDNIRPNERRLVSYAVDLAINASSRNSTDRQRVTRVRINKGVLIQESEMRETKTYTFRNEDTTPRTVIVEHPVRAGYSLRGEAKPEETTAQWMRFHLEIGAKQTATLKVEEARPLEASFQISQLNHDQVALFVKERSISSAVEEALRGVFSQRSAVDSLESQKDERDEEIHNIYDDQQRIRENLKALTDSANEKALVQRYTKQLDDQENRLDALRRENAQIQSRIDAANEVLEKTIQSLSFDEKL